MNRCVLTRNLCFHSLADDDDAWEPHHIQACLDALAQSPGSHMAVSGIVRHTHSTPAGPPALSTTSTADSTATAATSAAGVAQSLPPAGPLVAEPFLAGNPHIQGSNLFVRLDAVLAAGCFNEWLPSTTDRDLCLRLAGVGVQAAVTGVHSVHHYAAPCQPTLLLHQPAVPWLAMQQQQQDWTLLRQQARPWYAPTAITVGGCQIPAVLQSGWACSASTMTFGGTTWPQHRLQRHSSGHGSCLGWS